MQLFGPDKCDRENNVTPSALCYVVWAFNLVFTIIGVIVLMLAMLALSAMLALMKSFGNAVTSLNAEDKLKFDSEFERLTKGVSYLKMMIGARCIVMIFYTVFFYKHCARCNGMMGFIKLIILSIATNFGFAAVEKQLGLKDIKMDPDLQAKLENAKVRVRVKKQQ